MTAREVPQQGKPTTWRRLRDGLKKSKSPPRGKLIQRFPDIKSARAWLAQQSDQRAANVYLEYKQRDLLR